MEYNQAVILPQNLTTEATFSFPVVATNQLFKVSDVDSNTLIALVRERSQIWDKRLPKYANQPLVELAWDDISRIMAFPANILRRKWKSLRDGFSLELAKPHPPRWIHFEAMSFLTGYAKPRRSVQLPPKDPLATDPPPEDPLAIDPPPEDPLAFNPLPADPLAIDPLSEDPFTEDPRTGHPLNKDPRTLDDVETILVEDEEKFDPSKLGLVVVPGSHPEPTTTSIRIESDFQPAMKKTRIKRFNNEDRKPDLNDISLSIESSSSDFDSNSNQNVGCQTNVTDIGNHSTYRSNDHLNSNDASNSSLATLNESKECSIDSDRNPKPTLACQTTILNVKNEPKTCTNGIDQNLKRKLPSVKKCCRVCSSEMDASSKDPINRICSKCCQFISISYESNVKDSQALRKELNGQPESDENDANVTAIDLTEGETSSEDAEDVDFFRSLLPHVRRIPPHMKLRFRNRMHELVEEFAYPQVKIGNFPGEK